MKKVLLMSLCGLFVGTIAIASEECTYNPVQQTIRDAEYIYQVEGLKDNPQLNENFPCGGNAFQLSIIRGNYSNLNYLLQNGMNANDVLVPLGEEFKIKGAPNEIPAVLFAARYAPNADIIHTLLDNDIDPKVLDSEGHDFFWYLEKNPVLRKTYFVEGGYKELVSNIKKFYKEDVEDYQKYVVEDYPSPPDLSIIEESPETLADEPIEEVTEEVTPEVTSEE